MRFSPHSRSSEIASTTSGSHMREQAEREVRDDRRDDATATAQRRSQRRGGWRARAVMAHTRLDGQRSAGAARRWSARAPTRRPGRARRRRGTATAAVTQPDARGPQQRVADAAEPGEDHDEERADEVRHAHVRIDRVERRDERAGEPGERGRRRANASALTRETFMPERAGDLARRPSSCGPSARSPSAPATARRRRPSRPRSAISTSRHTGTCSPRTDDRSRRDRQRRRSAARAPRRSARAGGSRSPARTSRAST